MSVDSNNGVANNVEQGLDIANQIFGADVVAGFKDLDPEKADAIATQLADYALKTGSTAEQMGTLIGSLAEQNIDWVAALDGFSNSSNQDMNLNVNIGESSGSGNGESGIEAFLADEAKSKNLPSTNGIDAISETYGEGANPGGHDSGGSVPFGASGVVAGYSYTPAFGATFTDDSVSSNVNETELNYFQDVNSTVLQGESQSLEDRIGDFVAATDSSNLPPIASANQVGEVGQADWEVITTADKDGNPINVYVDPTAEQFDAEGRSLSDQSNSGGAGPDFWALNGGTGGSLPSNAFAQNNGADKTENEASNNGESELSNPIAPEVIDTGDVVSGSDQDANNLTGDQALPAANDVAQVDSSDAAKDLAAVPSDVAAQTASQPQGSAPIPPIGDVALDSPDRVAAAQWLADKYRDNPEALANVTEDQFRIAMNLKDNPEAFDHWLATGEAKLQGEPRVEANGVVIGEGSGQWTAAATEGSNVGLDANGQLIYIEKVQVVEITGSKTEIDPTAGIDYQQASDAMNGSTTQGQGTQINLMPINETLGIMDLPVHTPYYAAASAGLLYGIPTGTTVINGHANASGFEEYIGGTYRENGVPINADAIHEMIKETPNFSSTSTIVLAGCNTDNVAKSLSEKLPGVEVLGSGGMVGNYVGKPELLVYNYDSNGKPVYQEWNVYQDGKLVGTTNWSYGTGARDGKP